ncbi:hypothetical protein [Microvirga tunisiensis]|uniref:Uncharacterized protein n=1 Tax=Microvirga tunisiensis TaxID=2108360 RepID=A0A5N7MMV0_9HYPH|nr:hypothetical protein [Microvirga tunisiensis]MPR10155.1 hypothetical protein [Microvirga tunisiensis]MPR28361.1 hypothetical protein [Microvirga tunisiensis]
MRNRFRSLHDFDFDGLLVLRETLAKSEWGSIEQALASLTIFAHPNAVRAVGERAVFRNIRGTRGTIVDHAIGKVLADDNAGPAHAFQFSTSFDPGAHLQLNHIYAVSKCPLTFTDLRNLCYTPAFLAKVTDCQKKMLPKDHLGHLLRYRSYELFGYTGPERQEPALPAGYRDLEWADQVGADASRTMIEDRVRDWLRRNKKNRLTKSIRLCGWTFSDYRPDETVEYTGT